MGSIAAKPPTPPPRVRRKGRGGWSDHHTPHHFALFDLSIEPPPLQVNSLKKKKNCSSSNALGFFDPAHIYHQPPPIRSPYPDKEHRTSVLNAPEKNIFHDNEQPGRYFHQPPISNELVIGGRVSTGRGLWPTDSIGRGQGTENIVYILRRACSFVTSSSPCSALRKALRMGAPGVS